MSKSQCEIIIINQDHLQIDFKIIFLKSQFHDFTKNQDYDCELGIKINLKIRLLSWKHF